MADTKTLWTLPTAAKQHST